MIFPREAGEIMVSASRFRWALPLTAIALLTVTLVTADGASAASFEQIKASCIASVTPQMQACMQAKRGTGDRETNRAACRASVTPAVVACVRREGDKAAAGVAAPAAPKAEPAAAAKDVAAVSKTFVAPPRTIADIAAILDQEKPDAAKMAERQAAAEATPPKSGSASDLAQFYYDRGNARALLARNKEALADGAKAAEVGRGIPIRQINRIRQFIAYQHLVLGNAKESLAALNAVGEGAQVSSIRAMIQTFLAMGDVGQANVQAVKLAALVQKYRGNPHPRIREAYGMYKNAWEAEADGGRGVIFEARGQYREAEAAFARAQAFRRASMKDSDKWEYPPPPEQVILQADIELLSLARVKAKQGRLSEAEADSRQALLGTLKSQGKYNPSTPKFIIGLASILVEEGRYEEAATLTRSALEIQRSVGIRDDAIDSVSILSQLGGILTLQHKNEDASKVYAELEKAVAQWEPQRRDVFLLNGSRIDALYSSGQVDAGIAAALELVKRQAGRVGDNHFDTASARGTLAVGYAKAGRDGDAVREFKAAIPIMMAAARENADDDDTTVVAARSQRLQATVEIYIAVLARVAAKSDDAAAETFALSDAIRGHSVQRALAASSARMVATDPALAALVRKEQDLGKQVGALLGTLNNVLALPPSERDGKGVAAINGAIAKLRSERDQARQEINRRFPSYADLVDPRPPSIDQIKAALRPGEALLSFYFGRDYSFIWAVPKDGPVAFGAVRASALELEGKVRDLRKALEPQAALISDIPPFDLKLAFELYEILLRPVESGWKNAKQLIVVTNGALGLLPLSLLPTAPAQANDGDGALFSSYRNVPWLARSHAVTMVPSAAALRTLRALPAGSDKREPMIGFGDPLFSREQAEEAKKVAAPAQVAELSTRGLPLKRRSAPQIDGVDSAELALLPRLPDTADELKSIAAALEADPSKVVNLGANANEQLVKTSDLSKYKVLVFATHGLVPGELNGLTQPALALSAPDVAGVTGDGLLTMEEILTLKLDADWVVLSACNTGTGAGAGAEAASGLGRAFFYAGTRALLVTNWSVHSQSARVLTSDLFRRQAADVKMSRGEALRQAMTALIEDKGFTDDKGEVLFTYAHPLFWAPYTIIGDGG
jgi:CHAT domain-containing protein